MTTDDDEVCYCGLEMADHPDHGREDAIMLIMAAFETAAPERVNTPEQVTIAQGALALRALGVTTEEIRDAARKMGKT